jgi:Rrf2 family protein
MNGGYALARDADSITVFEVIYAVDGPLFLTACTSGPKPCDLTESCTIKEPMARVNDSITELLRGIRIGDLVDSDPHNAAKSHHAALVSIQM